MLDVQGRDFPGALGSGGSASASSAASSAESSGTSVESGAGGAGSGGGGQGGGEPLPICGDDFLQSPEECDDGNNVQGDGCGPSCKIENPNACPGTPITLDFTTIVIKGNTTGASDKLIDSAAVEPCPYGVWAGADLIYAVTPKKNGKLTATLKATYANHYMHVRTECPGSVQKEIGCDYASSAGTSDEIVVTVTAETTYYVSPDSYATTSGELELQLKLEP